MTNLQYLIYLQLSFSFISNIQSIFANENDYDENWQKLMTYWKHGIDIFVWLWVNCRLLCKPTTYWTFISLPANLLMLLFRGNAKLMDVLDQETEQNVQKVKNHLRKNNNRKHGQLKSFMDKKCFVVIGALDTKRLRFRGIPRKSEKWWKKDYDLSSMPDWVVKKYDSMKQLRSIDELNQFNAIYDKYPKFQDYFNHWNPDKSKKKSALVLQNTTDAYEEAANFS